MFVAFDRQVATSLLSILRFIHHSAELTLPSTLCEPKLSENMNIEQATLMNVANCIFEGVIGYVS